MAKNNDIVMLTDERGVTVSVSAEKAERLLAGSGYSKAAGRQPAKATRRPAKATKRAAKATKSAASPPAEAAATDDE